MTTPFSFEFFPPKTDKGAAKILEVHSTLQALGPQYFSVTYGAGGSTRDRTLSTVDAINGKINGEANSAAAPVAPHLSCIGDNKAKIAELLEHYKSIGINRLVALRGDLPSGQVGYGELPYARDLVEYVREHSGDHFHIEVAAYPEMHPQAQNFTADIDNLVAKFNAGADAAITQFFFNPDSYFYLQDKLVKRGIDKPLIAGIMPITSASNLIRFADSCGADIPRYIRKQLQEFGDDSTAIKQFGYDVVLNLCEKLIAGGVPAIHFYTMNKAEPNAQFVKDLGLI